MTDETYPWEKRETLSTKEAVEYLSVVHGRKRSVQTLNTWRCRENAGPAFYRRVGEVYYRKSDVDEWIAARTSQRVKSTSALPKRGAVATDQAAE